MRCACGHTRGWHRTRVVVRIVRDCHVWDCRCERFAAVDAPDAPEPPHDKTRVGR